MRILAKQSQCQLAEAICVEFASRQTECASRQALGFSSDLGLKQRALIQVTGHTALRLTEARF
jgi:hypothetical protein